MKIWSSRLKDFVGFWPVYKLIFLMRIDPQGLGTLNWKMVKDLNIQYVLRA